MKIKNIILKLLCVLMIVFQSSCAFKYEWFSLVALSAGSGYNNEYAIAFVSADGSEMSSSPYNRLRDFPFETNNINYLLIGDKISVKCSGYISSVTTSLIGEIEFENIKEIKIDRAPIEYFEVIEYIDNGVYYKQIMCKDESIELAKTYNDQNQVIMTEAIEIDKYKYTTLKELSVGTKLAATYYEDENGLNVSVFYLKSYIEKVTSK